MTVFRRIKQWIFAFIRQGGRKESLALLLVSWDKDFKKQLEANKPYEILVANCMESYGYKVEYVPLTEQHKGDLLLTDELSDDCMYLEVKADKNIASSGNLYIELSVDRESGTAQGWYYYDYTNLAVVESSRANGKPTKSIYMIDFEKMKSELDLEDARCKKIRHRCDNGNYNTALLVPLRYVQARGWLSGEYYFNADDWRQARQQAKVS